MRKYHLNEDYFKNIDTEEKAYWLGFICADGNISSTNRMTKSLRLRINLHEKDKDMLIKFRDAIQSNYPIRHFVSNKGVEGLESPQVKIEVNSNKLGDSLLNLGLTFNKTYSLDMPKINDCFKRHFIRGYFDGDGSISYSKRKKYEGFRYSFEIVGGSYKIIHNMCEFMNQSGIDVSIYTRKGKVNDTYRLMSGSLTTIKNIESFFYDDAHIFMNRKYLKTQEAINIAV